MGFTGRDLLAIHSFLSSSNSTTLKANEKLTILILKREKKGKLGLLEVLNAITDDKPYDSTRLHNWQSLRGR